jgi:hypothetical protein
MFVLRDLRVQHRLHLKLLSVLKELTLQRNKLFAHFARSECLALHQVHFQFHAQQDKFLMMAKHFALHALLVLRVMHKMLKEMWNVLAATILRQVRQTATLALQATAVRRLQSFLSVQPELFLKEDTLIVTPVRRDFNARSEASK